jgi:hypothetical protein
MGPSCPLTGQPPAFAETEIAGKTRFGDLATRGREAVAKVGSGRELSACHPITWRWGAHMIEPWHMPVAKTVGIYAEHAPCH